MASTVPAKSQPLHNFTLPHLKWNKDGHSSGQHHRRRSVKSPSRRHNPPSASPVRYSPLRDSVTATSPRYQSPLRDLAALASPRESPVHGNYLGKQSVIAGVESSKPECVREVVKPTRHHLPSRNLLSESENLGRIKGASIEHHRRNSSKNFALDSTRNASSERGSHKSEARSKSKNADGAVIKRSKILIKIPCNKTNKPDEEHPQEPPKIDNHNEDTETDEAREEGKINGNTDEETKTWNLRPRKPIRKSLNLNGGTPKSNGSSVPEKHRAQSPSRNMPKRDTEGPKCSGEKRKLSVSVALSKEEIEQDIFALTGSKPARRPKKRAKNIQKQVDAVFPGMWLVAINADSYKVSENSLKG